MIVTLIIINIVLLYIFQISYNGKIRQALSAQTNAIRSLGTRVDRMLMILMSAILPCVMTLGIVVANESAMKPSDNLFYLIK
ncbi:MAG: hypothetical protein WCJ81_03695 [bacterium]